MAVIGICAYKRKGTRAFATSKRINAVWSIKLPACEGNFADLSVDSSTTDVPLQGDAPSHVCLVVTKLLHYMWGFKISSLDKQSKGLIFKSCGR
jgi:hypothetical protein